MAGMTGYIPTLDQVDQMHHALAQSQAAYDLIHTHCVVVATIARQLARHQNALFAATASDDVSDDISDGVRGGSVPQHPIDEQLVVLGAMVHDIGTYRVLAQDGSDNQPVHFDGPRYILHGLLGYQYLLGEGVDESVAEFARNHTGVGLTREQVQAQGLPLPAGDYTPTTLEQEVVMVADKYHSKSVPPKFLTVDAYTAKAARYGEDNRRRWLELVARYGVPDVPALARQFHMRVV